MSKFVQTSFGNKKSILKFPDHYVNVAVTLDNTGIAANADGKKIIPAGTILGGGVLADPTKKAVGVNDGSAEGILFNDADVTYGPAPGAMLVHGFVDLGKLPVAPAAAAVTALPLIKFLK